jgi:hypothetical protein
VRRGVFRGGSRESLGRSSVGVLNTRDVFDVAEIARRVVCVVAPRAHLHLAVRVHAHDVVPDFRSVVVWRGGGHHAARGGDQLECVRGVWMGTLVRVH